MTDRPVRVLGVIARMNVGGPAQMLAGVLRGLDPVRFPQRLAVGAVTDDEADWFALRAPDLAGDPRIVTVPGLGRAIDPIGDVRALTAIGRELARHPADVVHTHTAKAGAVGRVATRRAHVPALVHTFHGHVLHGYFSPPVTAAFVAVERTLARRTDRLLAVGARVRDELLAAGIGRSEQYRVVPPGVEPPARPPRDEARHRLGLPVDAPVVAFVGRLATVKRPDRFADLAARASALRPGTVFVVAGGGPPGAAEALVARAPAADLRTLGWIGDVGDVYAAADVVVLTSDNEGMPVSLVEAGMAGRPCLTTDVGSASEVVLDRRTGRVVPVDLDALTAALVELLDDPALRERYGAAARDHTVAAFGMPALVAATAAVYEELAG